MPVLCEINKIIHKTLLIHVIYASTFSRRVVGRKIYTAKFLCFIAIIPSIKRKFQKMVYGRTKSYKHEQERKSEL